MVWSSPIVPLPRFLRVDLNVSWMLQLNRFIGVADPAKQGREKQGRGDLFHRRSTAYR